MNTKRLNFIHFGPDVPVVPVNHFSRRGLTDQQWSDAWRICGPSASMNMTRQRDRGPLEMWQVIAAAYLEGLQHGAELMQERQREATHTPGVENG